MVTNFARVLTAALSLATLGALAQSAQPASKYDPLDAKANVPPLHYRSSLPMVRASEADRTTSWREANDHVSRIGGWRTYARESQAAQTAPPVPAPAPPPAVPAPTSAAAIKPANKPLPAAPDHGGHKSP